MHYTPPTKSNLSFLRHQDAITSPTSIQNALKRAKNGVFSNTLSPATNTGGCVLPDITPNHTFPPNNMAMRSLIDGFQHETHCLPSHQTGNSPHSLSDNTFVDCWKSIGFIRLLLVCYLLNIGIASTQKWVMHPVTFLFVPKLGFLFHSCKQNNINICFLFHYKTPLLTLCFIVIHQKKSRTEKHRPANLLTAFCYFPFVSLKKASVCAFVR